MLRRVNRCNLRSLLWAYCGEILQPVDTAHDGAKHLLERRPVRAAAHQLALGAQGRGPDLGRAVLRQDLQAGGRRRRRLAEQQLPAAGGVKTYLRCAGLKALPRRLPRVVEPLFAFEPKLKLLSFISAARSRICCSARVSRASAAPYLRFMSFL